MRNELQKYFFSPTIIVLYNLVHPSNVFNTSSGGKKFRLERVYIHLVVFHSVQKVETKEEFELIEMVLYGVL